MKKLVLSGIILIITLFQTSAQKKWSLEECINYALENNIQIKQSKLSAESDKITLLQNKLGVLPNLNGGASYSSNWGRNIDPSSNTYSTDQTQSISLSLNSSIDLFSGFQKLNTIKQSDNNYQASKYDVEKMKNDIALRIAQAYMTILFNKEQVDVSKNQVEISKMQLARIKNLVDAGALAKGNLLDIQAQEALEESNLIAAQNQLDLSYLDLVQLLDLKSKDDFDIIKPDITMGNDVALIPTNQIYTYSSTIMPEIKSAEFRLKSSFNGLAIARGSRSPSLSLSGYYGSNYADNFLDYANPTITYEGLKPTLYVVSGSGTPVLQTAYSLEYQKMAFKDQMKNNLSKSLRLTLTIPIFNNYQVNAAISKAKLSTLNADYNLQLQKNQLYKNIEQAATDATGAFKSYNASAKAVDSYKEAFTYTEQKFNVGVVNPIDYNDAKNKLIKAESDLLRAKYNYEFKKVILNFYQGNPLTINK
ncbi:MAG: TolC family protein [Bacteroidota bacterium]